MYEYIHNYMYVYLFICIFTIITMNPPQANLEQRTAQRERLKHPSEGNALFIYIYIYIHI